MRVSPVLHCKHVCVKIRITGNLFLFVSLSAECFYELHVYFYILEINLFDLFSRNLMITKLITTKLEVCMKC